MSVAVHHQTIIRSCCFGQNDITGYEFAKKTLIGRSCT